MKTLACLVLAAGLAGGLAWAEETSAISPQEARGHILEHYVSIGKSLAADSLKDVPDDAEHIGEMAGEITKSGKKCGTTEEEIKKCEDRINTIKSSAEKLKAEKIEDVRSAYGDLSDALVECLTHCQAPEQEYHIFYCPMLKKHWIQDSKEVANPYDSKMTKCGELKKTVGGKSEGGHEEHPHKEGEKGHQHSSKGGCPFMKSEAAAKEHGKGCCAM